MILGIGTDIIEIARIAKLMQGQAGFLDRILTAREQQYVPARHERRMAEYIAGRFAAKEAVSKALGTGIGEQVSFQDIEIIPEANGKPKLQIREEVIARLFPGASSTALHISISHSTEYAVAHVIIERV